MDWVSNPVEATICYLARKDGTDSFPLEKKYRWKRKYLLFRKLPRGSYAYNKMIRNMTRFKTEFQEICEKKDNTGDQNLSPN